jgi:hypothetical protein
LIVDLINHTFPNNGKNNEYNNGTNNGNFERPYSCAIFQKVFSKGTVVERTVKAVEDWWKVLQVEKAKGKGQERWDSAIKSTSCLPISLV